MSQDRVLSWMPIMRDRLLRHLPQGTTWLAWLLPVFAWAPLTYPGYFEFLSGFLPIFNLHDLASHLGDLAWAPVIGQPYDLLRGERTLPYLAALVPLGLGATGVGAVKWVFGLSIVAGAVGIYGWVRSLLGSWPGLVAAAVYAFWPLGLATIYVRGALAEAVIWGLMPWLFWAADPGQGVPGWRRAGALTAALAAGLWTQTGLGLWLAGCALLYGMIVARAGRAGGQGERALPGRLAWWPLPVWVGGLLLGGLGLLPLALRHGLTGQVLVPFREHLVYPHQLLAAGWGLGPSIPGPDDTLPLQLGLVACGLALLALLLPQRELERGLVIRRRLAVAGALAPTFLATTLAAPFWQALPALAGSLTYPWQLLLLAGVWLAWLSGLAGRALLGLLPAMQRQSATIPLCAGLITLALLGSYSYLNPPTTSVLPPEAPVAIFGADQIALLRVAAKGVPGPAGRVVVAVEWQALQPLDQDYTVFCHVVTPDGTLWGQRDTMPQGGAFPTSQWRPGQVISDQYEITLKPDAPIRDDYRYLLGLYLWQTGERLPTQGDDKVTLSAAEISRPKE